MEGFQHVYDALKDLGAHVVGVSADTYAAQGVFADDLGLEFPLLSDWWENKTIDAFGVGAEGRPVALRTTFVFDAEGVVQAVIDDQREMEAHPEGALAAVRRLVTGSSK